MPKEKKEVKEEANIDNIIDEIKQRFGDGSIMKLETVGPKVL